MDIECPTAESTLLYNTSTNALIRGILYAIMSLIQAAIFRTISQEYISPLNNKSEIFTTTRVEACTIGVGRVVKLRSRLSGSQNLLFLSYCDDCYKAAKEGEATVSQILDEIIMQSSSFEQTLLVCKRWTYFYHLLFLSIILFHHFLHFENFGVS